MRHSPAPGMAPGFTLGAPSVPLPSAVPFFALCPMGKSWRQSNRIVPLIPKSEGALDSTLRSFLFPAWL